MYKTIAVVYENGVLRPLTPLTGLHEGQQVQATLLSAEPPLPEGALPLSDEEDERLEEEFSKEMEAEGLLERFPPPDSPPPADFTPLVIPGPPMSQQIIEDRR